MVRALLGMWGREECGVTVEGGTFGRDDGGAVAARSSAEPGAEGQAQKFKYRFVKGDGCKDAGRARGVKDGLQRAKSRTAAV